MISDPDVVGLLYLVSIVCFILALRFLSSPKQARRGNWVGGVGMVIAIATTLALDGISNWLLIVVGGLIGSSLIGIFSTKGPQIAGVNFLSFVGFVLSSILGLWLTVGIAWGARAAFVFGFFVLIAGIYAVWAVLFGRLDQRAGSWYYERQLNGRTDHWRDRSLR